VDKKLDKELWRTKNEVKGYGQKGSLDGCNKLKILT
jgi:hypothetical protein